MKTYLAILLFAGFLAYSAYGAVEGFASAIAYSIQKAAQ